MPDLLATVKKNATLDGKLYALPYVWGAEGLVANTKRAKITDYQDLCKPEYKGKTTLRLRRPTLMAFALRVGQESVFTLRRSQGVHRADGTGRAHADGLQTQPALLL